MKQKTLRRIYQHFSELCEFKGGFVIDGKFINVGKINTKEECAQKVRGEYPDATGVTWHDRDGYNGVCYAEFGNNFTPSLTTVFGCLFHGISYFIYLYILQFFCFITYYITQQ